MTHQDAVTEMAVEQYLLGELSGEARHRFEEHLFDCPECAADLKQGAVFLNAARTELKSPAKASANATLPMKRRSTPLAWLSQPWVLVPALAACLLVIVYQSAVLLPRMKADVAELQTPAVLAPLALANAGARGDTNTPLAEIVAPRHGFYVLSVDIPPAAGASGYRCSFYSPAGTLVWHIDVSPEQARDAVMIQVPVMTANEGINELHVQSLPFSRAPEQTRVDLARYRYKLSFAK